MNVGNVKIFFNNFFARLKTHIVKFILARFNTPIKEDSSIVNVNLWQVNSCKRGNKMKQNQRWLCTLITDTFDETRKVQKCKRKGLDTLKAPFHLFLEKFHGAYVHVIRVERIDIFFLPLFISELFYWNFRTHNQTFQVSRWKRMVTKG